MRSTRATPHEPFLLRNTLQITTGHLDSFTRAIQHAVEPHMLAYSFQLYRDSQSIIDHWQMSDPYIREVMKHCTVQRLDVYGQSNKAAQDGIAQSSSDDVIVTVTPRFNGFTRLPGNR